VIFSFAKDEVSLEDAGSLRVSFYIGFSMFLQSYAVVAHSIDESSTAGSTHT
jgi:hypothetical protein